VTRDLTRDSGGCKTSHVRGLGSISEFTIYGQPGCFTVNFRSPNNALHQISGFKTEDDAQSWVKETRRLIATLFDAEPSRP
jgi:hypothetical protein